MRKRLDTVAAGSYPATRGNQPGAVADRPKAQKDRGPGGCWEQPNQPHLESDLPQDHFVKWPNSLLLVRARSSLHIWYLQRKAPRISEIWIFFPSHRPGSWKPIFSLPRLLLVQKSYPYCRHLLVQRFLFMTPLWSSGSQLGWFCPPKGHMSLSGVIFWLSQMRKWGCYWNPVGRD